MVQLFKTLSIPIFLGFIFLGGYLFFYLGGWQKVTVSLEDRPAIFLLYQEHIGPYHQIGPKIEAVEKYAKENRLSCKKTFGEYLDNPRETEEARLRSNAGCLIDTPVAEQQLGDSLKFRELPAQKYLTAEFLGSPAIGPWKVYPRLDEFAQAQKLKRALQTFEIYTLLDDNKMKTEYLQPLESSAP